uniref:Gypsy retrotransposon integrase-like protein 1 n=1 Tax=Anolis carolinensis TaxID=28377 RepID=A0A803TUR5_ANOCA
GAVLMQPVGEHLHPGAYYSRQLTAPERNYTIWEKELLIRQGLRFPFSLKNDLLCYRNHVYIPPGAGREKALCLCHDTGHFGFVKTLHLVRRKYWWPLMRKDVKAYVHQCPVCATVKGGGGKPSGLLRPLENPAAPWEHISMDFIVDLPPSNGKTVIWVVVDLFSKQAHFIPCRSMPNAEQLAQLFIEHCYKHHGAPSKVISDRGSVFVSRFWKAFLRQLGAKQALSTAYHPQTDGQTERVNQVLEQYLRCYTNYQQDNWSKFLAYAQVAYNNSVHSSTGHSPFEIVYGRNLRTLPTPEVIQSDPVPFAEWMARIKDAWPVITQALDEAKAAYKHQADKHRRPDWDLKPGQQVYLSTKYLKGRQPTKKLAAKYIGPFAVKRLVNEVTAELELPQFYRMIHPVFHFSLLKPAPESSHWHPVQQLHLYSGNQVLLNDRSS